MHPAGGDFRKGINGLSTMVESEFALDVFSQKLFVFTNRRRDKVKILYWERSGFCLWMTCMDALMPRAQDAQER